MQPLPLEAMHMPPRLRDWGYPGEPSLGELRDLAMETPAFKHIDPKGPFWTFWHRFYYECNDFQRLLLLINAHEARALSAQLRGLHDLWHRMYADIDVKYYLPRSGQRTVAKKPLEYGKVFVLTKDGRHPLPDGPGVDQGPSSSARQKAPKRLVYCPDLRRYATLKGTFVRQHTPYVNKT